MPMPHQDSAVYIFHAARSPSSSTRLLLHLHPRHCSVDPKALGTSPPPRPAHQLPQCPSLPQTSPQSPTLARLTCRTHPQYATSYCHPFTAIRFQSRCHLLKATQVQRRHPRLQSTKSSSCQPKAVQVQFREYQLRTAQVQSHPRRCPSPPSIPASCKPIASPLSAHRHRCFRRRHRHCRPCQRRLRQRRPRQICHRHRYHRRHHPCLRLMNSRHLCLCPTQSFIGNVPDAFRLLIYGVPPLSTSPVREVSPPHAQNRLSSVPPPPMSLVRKVPPPSTPSRPSSTSSSPLPPPPMSPAHKPHHPLKPVRVQSRCQRPCLTAPLPQLQNVCLHALGPYSRSQPRCCCHR